MTVMFMMVEHLYEEWVERLTLYSILHCILYRTLSFFHSFATDCKAFHGQIRIPIYKNYGQWASTISQQKQERHFDKYADLGLVNLLLSSCLLGLMVYLFAANVKI